MNSFEAMRFILSVVSDEYAGLFPVREEVTEKEFAYVLRLADRNGLKYHFLSCLHRSGLFDALIEPHRIAVERERVKLIRTLSKIGQLSREFGFDYLVVKVPTTIPHIPRDVDLLIHPAELDRARKALEHYRLTYYAEVYGSGLKGDYWPIDIYEKIEYYGVVGLQDESLWGCRAVSQAFGVEFPGLNNEMNFLLTVIHSVFGHRRMTLLDFLHMHALLKRVSLDVCWNYARLSGWAGAFNLILDRLEEIHNQILAGQIVQFPYLFNLDFCLDLFASMDGVKIGSRQKVLLTLLLTRERAIRMVERSRLYEFLLRRVGLRNFLNHALSKVTTTVERATKFKG